ncbi:MAG: hypothetical protein IPJ34_27880 [Myxococcales bacterium]|nr:hypothetical protein [Myxococcales bacterium]
MVDVDHAAARGCAGRAWESARCITRFELPHVAGPREVGAEALAESATDKGG